MDKRRPPIPTLREVGTVALLALVLTCSSASALELSANQDLDSALNTWQNLVGTDDSITYYPSGVYDWANKNGGNGVATANLVMKGYKVYTDNGSSIELRLNGGSITNGGDISTAVDGSTGNITITNAASISVNKITADVMRTSGDGALSSGYISISHSGSLTADSTITRAFREGTTGNQLFRGDDTGIFTLLSSGMAIDGRHTGGMPQPAASVTILDYTAVSILGDIDTTSTMSSGGAVKIGDSGNPIGGSITIGKITTHMSGGANGGEVSLYANGAIVAGDIVSGANSPTTYNEPATEAGNVTVVGKSLTAGVIQAWSRREGGTDPGKISLTGTDGSGACTVTSLSTERSSYPGSGRNAASITISNFVSITVNGDVRADVVMSDGNSQNGGAITMNSGIGGIDIKGALSANALATGTDGSLSLATPGGITIGSLDMSKVNQAKFDCGTICVVTGALSSVVTNFTSGSGTEADPYVTTQKMMQVKSGKYLYYTATVGGNAYLGGFAYKLADLSGTAGAGGLLTPFQAPCRGTVFRFR